MAVAYCYDEMPLSDIFVLCSGYLSTLVALAFSLPFPASGVITPQSLPDAQYHSIGAQPRKASAWAPSPAPYSPRTLGLWAASPEELASLSTVVSSEGFSFWSQGPFPLSSVLSASSS